MLAAEILATETAAIRTNFAAESVSQILAKQKAITFFFKILYTVCDQQLSEGGL